MSNKVELLLTEGLTQGYAGTKKPLPVERAGFRGKANDHVTPDGHYHDEWFASDNGGGQELVEVDDGKFTRLYGGGVASQEQLQELGITTKDITQRLISSVRELKGKTRLYEPCQLMIDPEWVYSYTIILDNPEIQLTVGHETIGFKGNEVFAHVFILTPIK